jgi:hypothetical protein
MEDTGSWSFVGQRIGFVCSREFGPRSVYIPLGVIDVSSIQCLVDIDKPHGLLVSGRR